MSSKFNFDKYETLKNEEKKEVEKVMENKVETIESEPKDEIKEVKKVTRKTITREEMDEIVDALFDKIKKELSYNEYRLHKGIHKENVDMMEIFMERITDLENKIK